MKSNRLDQFTIVATFVGFVVDLSSIGGFGSVDGSSAGIPDKPGLALALLSFYSLTLISFIARRLLYKHKANQIRTRLAKSKPEPVARKAISNMSDGDILRQTITVEKLTPQIDSIEFVITWLAAGIVLWHPILAIDWMELQFNLTYYTYLNEIPFIVLIVMFISLVVLASSLTARKLYSAIVGFD